jgi:toxin-antitoxin system PIN domain toxin
VTALLDGNVLVALAVPGHVHHEPAEQWFASRTESFATCPVTQGTLLRITIRFGADARQAMDILRAITDDDRHVFWADDLSYVEVSLVGVVGHRQVTDAYLAALARQLSGTVATFDRGFAALYSDVAEIVPSHH